MKTIIFVGKVSELKKRLQKSKGGSHNATAA